MRQLLLFLALFVFSCHSKKDVFDEADYVLVKSDSLNGIVGTEWFVYKYDSLRMLQVDYYGDGKLMGKAFSYNGELDGRRVTYDFNGKSLLAVDSYSNGKKVIPTKYFKPVDTTVKVFSDGKLEPFTSLDSLK